MTVEPLRDPILVAAFEGWNDAANAASDAMRFLLRTFMATEAHELEPQEYSDFQAARPHVEINNGVVKSLRWPSTKISIATVFGSGRDLILVHGIEPNLRWQQFCDEILAFAEVHDTRTVVTLGALLGDAPHTRDFPITGTASDPALVERLGLQRSSYQGPTGIIGVMSSAARVAELESISLWVPVPHYVSSAPSPKATYALLERFSTLLEVPLDLRNLGVASRGWQTHVDSMVETDGDLTAYVHELESRYDNDDAASELETGFGDLDEDLSIEADLDDFEAYTIFDDSDDNDFDDFDEEEDEEEDDDDIFDEDNLPTGESLAQDFERYLRDQQGPDQPTPGDSP